MTGGEITATRLRLMRHAALYPLARCHYKFYDTHHASQRRQPPWRCSMLILRRVREEEPGGEEPGAGRGGARRGGAGRGSHVPSNMGQTQVAS
eukprot:scaffold6705_cov31-Tisochrysis_lutea.AAC.1